MKWLRGLGFSWFLLLTAVGMAAPGPEGKPVRTSADPLGQVSYVDSFEAHKRASAIVIGDGTTVMALYVFDRWGNCVAKDEGVAPVRDDLAVEWYPTETSLYSIDICNFGRSANNFTVVIK